MQILPDRGFKNDMKSIPIDCSFCQWTGVLNNYQVIYFIFELFLNLLSFLVSKEHLDQFHSNLNCESCDEHFNSVDKFNQHKIFECSKLIVECILKGFGCNERV